MRIPPPLLLVLLAAVPAAAQGGGGFAGRSFDIRFTEVQFMQDPERPEIPQNRRTLIEVGAASAAARISRNWDKPPPGLENLDAAGPLGAWVSLENRARLQHKVEGNRLTQTILTASFVTRLIIELDGAGCAARIDYMLAPGETHFRMRNIALGTPMRVDSIRTRGAVDCAVADERAW